jgi:hypothetical protein
MDPELIKVLWLIVNSQGGELRLSKELLSHFDPSKCGVEMINEVDGSITFKARVILDS